jgi:predicted nuclease with TOPRIM domain
MKKYRLVLALATILILCALILAGCASGIPQAQYDSVSAQLAEAKEQLARSQDEANTLRAEKSALESELQAAQAKVTELSGQVGGLKEQATLAGATPAETAEKIVRNYHETHVYSTYDLFVCSDMASEVWNMLKAQGIAAIIVVGNKDAAISDILQSDHAWVLAEVAPGEYLALETTGGFAVPRSQNPLYYRGWSFRSPADLKANNDLVKEYNIRVSIHNEIVAEEKEVINEYNRATDQKTADKLEAVHNKLVELIEAQETELKDIMSRINGLATRLP